MVETDVSRGTGRGLLLLDPLTQAGILVRPGVCRWHPVGLARAPLSGPAGFLHTFGRAMDPPGFLSYVPFLLALASLTYLLWLSGDDLNHCTIMLVLDCSLSAAVPYFSASRPLAPITFAIFGSALLGTAIFAGTPAYHALALVILLYFLILYLILRESHTTTTNMLVLGYQNSDLLAEQRSLIESKNALIGELAPAQ